MLKAVAVALQSAPAAAGVGGVVGKLIGATLMFIIGGAAAATGAGSGGGGAAPSGVPSTNPTNGTQNSTNYKGDEKLDPTLLPKSLVKQEGKIPLPKRWKNQDLRDVTPRPVKIYDLYSRSTTGACGYNRPCAHQYVCKYQSCMVLNGRLIPHASYRHAGGGTTHRAGYPPHLA